MTRRWTTRLGALLLPLPVLLLHGCDDRRAKKLGHEVDDAVDDVKDSLRRDGEKVERAGERLHDRLRRDADPGTPDHETIDTSDRHRPGERGIGERAGEKLDDLGHELRDAVDHDGPAERAGQRIDQSNERR
jgi:hypothetical protein